MLVGKLLQTALNTLHYFCNTYIVTFRKNINFLHQYTSLSLSLLLLSRLFTAFCTQLEAVWPILSQMSQSLHEQKKFLMNKKTTNFPVVSSLCFLKKNNNFRYLWTITNSLFPIFQHIKTAPVDYLCSKSFQRSPIIYQLPSLKL